MKKTREPWNEDTDEFPLPPGGYLVRAVVLAVLIVGGLVLMFKPM